MEPLMRTSLKDISRKLSSLSRTNKAIARCPPKLGSNADTFEFRENIQRDIHTSTVLIREIKQSIAELKSENPRNHTVLKLEKQFIAEYDFLRKQTQTINVRLRQSHPKKTQPIIAATANRQQYNPNDAMAGNRNRNAFNPSNLHQSSNNYDRTRDGHYNNHSNSQHSSQMQSQMQSQQQMQRNDLEIVYDIAEMEEREEAVHKIVDDLQELNEAYQDLHSLIGEQAEQVEQIATNVEDAKDEVGSGVEHLDKAAQHQRGFRKKLCLVLLIVVIIAAVLAVIFFAILKK